MGLIMLEIKSGGKDEECVLLEAKKNINSSHFMVVDNSYHSRDGDVSNSGNFAYRFQAKFILAGEQIELYTKAGEYKKIKNSEGAIVHRFFWGQKAPIWQGEWAHLLKIVDSIDYN